MRWIIILAIVGLTLYLLLAALLYTQQRRILFPAPTYYMSPEQVGLPDMREIEMRFGEDSWATAWWAPPSSPDGEIVMVFHGNGSAVYSNIDIFRDLIAAGHGVWSVGYPGYPGITPEPSRASEAHLVEAAREQREELDRLNTSGRPVNYYGTSLGSGIALQLARTHPPERMFADAPFFSALDMARLRLPIFPHGLMMKDHLRSDQALTEIDVPLYWMHGTADNIVPISEGRKFFEAYEGPKEALVIPNGQHTNSWHLGGRDFVLKRLASE